MRRSKVLTSLIAVASLASAGSFMVGTAGVAADTATPDIADEGWFARFKPEDFQTNPPCNELAPVYPSSPVPGCGPVSPGDNPAPQSKSTGHYVVASRGGPASDESEGGDTGWAAFKWDLFEFEGATAEKFVVNLHQGIDNSGRNQGDTYPNTPAVIQACNVLEDWSAESGSNPWTARPKVSKDCIVPTVSTTNNKVFTFDVSQFAQSWIENKGFGFVIRPGTPTTKVIERPFQITFAGYFDPGTASAGCTTTADADATPQPPSPAPPVTSPVPPTTTDGTVSGTVLPCTTTPPAPKPVVTFSYSPASEDDLFGDIGDDFGGGDEIFEDVSGGDGAGGVLEAVGDIDVIPTDEGSPPLPEDAGAPASDELAAPLAPGSRTRPISSDAQFPWMVLFLLPLAAVAFWGTGTALGPIGDPVPARTGGVSRVLAERHAAHGGFDSRRGN